MVISPISSCEKRAEGASAGHPVWECSRSTVSNAVVRPNLMLFMVADHIGKSPGMRGITVGMALLPNTVYPCGSSEQMAESLAAGWRLLTRASQRESMKRQFW
jgi:hypothetical protein